MYNNIKCCSRQIKLTPPVHNSSQSGTSHEQMISISIKEESMCLPIWHTPIQCSRLHSWMLISYGQLNQIEAGNGPTFLPSPTNICSSRRPSHHGGDQSPPSLFLLLAHEISYPFYKVRLTRKSVAWDQSSLTRISNSSVLCPFLYLIGKLNLMSNPAL